MADSRGRGRGGASRGRGGGRDRGAFQGGFHGSRGGGAGGGGGGGFRGGHGKVPSPDPNVVKLENQVVERNRSTVEGLTGKMASLALEPSDVDIMPCRPAFGTAGTEVILWANYFPVHFKCPVLYKYDVMMAGKATAVASKGKLQTSQTKDLKGPKLHLAMQQVLSHLSAKAGKKMPLASQFKNYIISLEKLDLQENPLSVTVPREGEDQDPDIIIVSVHGPVEIRTDDLVSYARTMDDHGEKLVFPKFPDVVDVVDIILGHNARSRAGEVAAIGNSRFFPFDQAKKTASLMQDCRGLIAARGFFQSARLATGRLLLNTNVTHGVFKISGKVDEAMNHLGIQCAPAGDYRLRRLVGAFAKFLPKTRVWVTFTIENGTRVRRNKAILGLVNRLSGKIAEGDEKAPVIESGWEYPGPKQIKFWLTDDRGGRYITVFDYYKKILNLGTQKRPTFYPAEVVEIRPGQSVKAKLTAEETTAMLTFACRTPYENAISIAHDARGVLSYDQNPLLEKFGVSIDKNLATVSGRVLAVPVIAYIDAARKLVPVRPANGTWNMKAVRVVKPGAPISSWTYINIVGREEDGHRGVGQEAMEEFATFMADAMGVRIAKKPIRLPKHFMTQRMAMGEGLDNLFKWAGSNRIQHIMFVLARKDSSGLYAKIKRLGDCQYGIHTNCLVAKHLQKANNYTYYSNVGLKVNLKAGGVNHKLSNEFGLLKEGKTMFVGYDVTHPTNMNVTKGSEPPSLVGLVASVDRDLAQWPALAWEQRAKQEMLGAKLLQAFQSRLRLWQSRNGGSLPDNIVIFRDGVSDGQFVQVLDEELPTIREACRETYGGGGGGGGGKGRPQPKLSLIVSVKRHQTRFFPTDAASMSRSGNVKNGTVVDRGVTLAAYWDFFLTAHDALQGTARPAHYTVLLDEIFRYRYGKTAANEVERLTHELCYLFGRATKAVSICPPAYYADIVCERARAHRPEYDVSDVESVDTAGTGSSAASATVRQVHESLRDTMYYI
ncbi:hypothetical protein UVI_02024090 [Ustilaginoidea virens]|uniref:Piwi domain-containing protein n=1 Tax=Ustilaginoidea virens TaxID=1159556 RepID=A0A1B5L1Z9_USTVR|nr:hypothetical protein UVI_02024090 [Ustilaginoidea virens]